MIETMRGKDRQGGVKIEMSIVRISVSMDMMRNDAMKMILVSIVVETAPGKQRDVELEVPMKKKAGQRAEAIGK